MVETFIKPIICIHEEKCAEFATLSAARATVRGGSNISNRERKSKLYHSDVSHCDARDFQVLSSTVSFLRLILGRELAIFS